MKKFVAILPFISSFLIMLGSIFAFGSLDPEAFPRPQTQPFFTPEPYTFGIWAVIYIWMLIATFTQWRKHGENVAWEAMRLPLSISLILGMIWPAAANANVLLGTLTILAMWGSALYALIKTPQIDIWYGIYPIGLYVGWLSAATGVSTTTWLYQDQILSNLTASIIGLAIGAALAFVAISRKPAAITTTIAVVWALIGVIVYNLSGGNMIILALCALAAIGFGIWGYRSWKAKAA